MQTPFLSGDILQQNGGRAGWHNPPAIFVAGAQRDARVLHCKNPVHSPGTPRRLNGYPGCQLFNLDYAKAQGSDFESKGDTMSFSRVKGIRNWCFKNPLSCRLNVHLQTD